MTGWAPATSAEQAMLAAEDPAALLTALVSAPLLMPISPSAAAGLEPVGWATGVHDGVTHVLAFTSPEAIAACLPGRPVTYRTDSVPTLAANWPDPSWVLAVDLGLPIGLVLTGPELAALPDITVDGESELRAAVAAADVHDTTAAMLRSPLFLPLRADAPPTRDLGDPGFGWPVLASPPGIVAYTSEARMRQAAGETDWVSVSSLQLTTHWPDSALPLLLNAGTPLAVEIDGKKVQELGEWLGSVRTALASPPSYERDPDAPVRSQVVVPPMYVAAYLEQGYDRVAGLVHAWYGPGRDTPARLYERLGLLGDGSPYQLDDPWVVVLRWESSSPPPDPPRLESLVVPDGAGLHRIEADGTDTLVAVYDVAAGRWA